MIRANTMTAAEEKALLKGWFETVQFDVDYAGIPPMQDEDDDEESRSSQLIEWFQSGSFGPAPEAIEDDLWSTLDESHLGMSRSTARAIYRQEMEFQKLFGRANPYHDEKGKFAKGSSGGGGIATSTKTTNISDTQAESLRQRVRTPDGGFTVDVRTGKDVTTGFAVAIHEDRSVDIPAKDIKGSHLQSFVDKNQDLFTDERSKFGAWHDPDTGQVWLDVSTVVKDRGEAIELGKKHNQISIFHLDDFEVINTGGTGRSWLAWRNEQRIFGGGAGPKVMARFNPNHDKGGKFASHKGFGNFEKSEATVVWGGSYVKARVWSVGQHSIIVTDSKFPDAMVEQRVIPTLNKLQSSNPLPAGKLLNVSIEPSLFHKGHAVHGLTEVGSGNIKLNGKDLGPTIGDLNINEGVDVGFFPPAARNRGVDAVIAHEWGHSITTSPDEAQTMFANLPTRPSKYADTDGLEAYAENFSEFFLSNGTTTSSSAQQYAKEFEWKA